MARKPRSISDAEIALIRAMVGRGISKTTVQAYFTHPSRPLNFGRITNIGDGKYGPEIPPATNAEVDDFIAEWEHRHGRDASKLVLRAFDFSLLPPNDERRIRSLFTQNERGVWQLAEGETDQAECKQSFNLGPKVMRAIAAFANNRGGYIFFGVADHDYSVVGLANDRFETIDPARLSLTVRSFMEPAPRVQSTVLKFGSNTVGILYVHPDTDGPIIATKTEQEFREGTIYFRYSGESRAIAAAEFRKILADRDRRLREATRAEIGRLLELGPRGAVVDLASNTETVAKVVREGIDEADVLRNFIRQERVEFPLAYLLRSCTTAKSWLPIFYYVQQANLSLAGAISIVEQKETSYLARKRDLLARLRGTKSATSKPWGRIATLRAALLAGSIKEPTQAKDAGDVATAITTLMDTKCDLVGLLSLLRSATDAIRADPTAKADVWSSIYKAAARIDELYFRPIHVDQSIEKGSVEPPIDAITERH